MAGDPRSSVATPERIVERFLGDPYHEGIPIGEVGEGAGGACFLRLSGLAEIGAGAQRRP